MINVGQKALDFELPGVIGDTIKTYKLSQLRTKWVVLFFYPLDFTFVCPTEMLALNEHYDSFRRAGAEVFGISCDSIHSHQAWAKSLGGLNFALLADYQKRMTHQYGVLDQVTGTAQRAVYIIDPEGRIRWEMASGDDVGRSVPELLRALQALQTGKLCPADWSPGKATLS